MEANGSFVVKRTSAIGLKGMSESFHVTDESGSPVLEFKYSMHMGSQEWHVLDTSGAEVANMQRHAHVHPQFDITRPGRPDVTVRKANFMPVSETWRVEGLEGGDVDVSGSITDHEFTFTNQTGAVVAQSSRQWVSVHETYGVRVSGMDAVVALCAAVGMDVIENQH